jgi:hypothetical protein
LDDIIKVDDMGGACSRHGRDEKCVKNGWKTLSEETTRKT